MHALSDMFRKLSFRPKKKDNDTSRGHTGFYEEEYDGKRLGVHAVPLTLAFPEDQYEEEYYDDEEG